MNTEKSEVALEVCGLEADGDYLKKWWDDGGDQRFRFSYDLSQGAIVMDIGGYHGGWAEEILARYDCRVHVYEPLQEFSEGIHQRFGSEKRAIVHPYALGLFTGEMQMSVSGDASSSYLRADRMEKVTVKDAVAEVRKFVQSEGKVDLMKLNIEGGEYDLLEYLIREDEIRHVTNIQVQFHAFMPDATTRMHTILSDLSATHRPAWRYPFVWESWERVKDHQ